MKGSKGQLRLNNRKIYNKTTHLKQETYGSYDFWLSTVKAVVDRKLNPSLYFSQVIPNYWYFRFRWTYSQQKIKRMLCLYSGYTRINNLMWSIPEFWVSCCKECLVLSHRTWLYKWLRGASTVNYSGNVDGKFIDKEAVVCTIRFRERWNLDLDCHHLLTALLYSMHPCLWT